MSTDQKPSEAKAVWREFKETAWDLTRDLTSLTWRTPAQYYSHLRTFGVEGKPASPLAAAIEVTRVELTKCAGGAPGIFSTPTAFVTGLIASNVMMNTALAKTFWLDKDIPILPNHSARLKARAAANEI
jgi:hypothetical protein